MSTKLPTLYWQSSKSGIMFWDVEIIENKDNHGVIIIKRGFKGGKVQKSEQIIDSGKNIGKKNETTPFQRGSIRSKIKVEFEKTKNSYSENIAPIEENFTICWWNCTNYYV